MKRRIVLFFPFLPFLIFISPFFFQLEFPVHKENNFYIYNSETGDLEQPPNRQKAIQKDWFLSKGIFNDFFFTKQIINDLDIGLKEKESYYSETLEKLERKLLSQMLSILFLAFLVFLCFSSFWSILKNSWFAAYLNKVLYWLVLFYILENILFLGDKLAFFPQLVAFLMVKNLFLFIYVIFCFIFIQKIQNSESFSFQNLTYLRNQETKGSRNISIFRTIFHFVLILIFGLLVGNLVYIPFFSLQKNFSTEFGVVFLFLIFALIVFYIKNYYSFAKESYYSNATNILLSFSFLQFRILKNTLLSVCLTLIIALFFSILFSILFLNIDFLDGNFSIFNQKDYF